MLSKNEKCKSLFYLIAVTLIFINPVCASDIFVNGGFETGNTTGWEKSYYYYSTNIIVGSEYSNGSDYGVRLYGHGEYENAEIHQTVDLTGIDNIPFSYNVHAGRLMVGTSFGSTNLFVSYSTGGNWTQGNLDVSGLSGNHDIYFDIYDNPSYPHGSTVYLDNIGSYPIPDDTTITFNPDYVETNSTYWPGVDVVFGNGDYPQWPYYHVKLYYYQWINNSWGAKTLYTYKEQEWPRDTVSYFSIIEGGSYDWPTFTNLVFKKKLEVDLIYPGNNSIIATDSYIYNPDYVPPPPPPEEPPEDPPEPNATAEPTPGPDPEPPEEPPTGPGANETLNVTWVDGYNDKVNNTVDYLFEPIYNFSYQMVYPVLLLNTTLGDFKVSMNQTLNNASVSIGLSTTLLFIVMDSFPQKLINVMLYYFIWLIILIIFKGDM